MYKLIGKVTVVSVYATFLILIMVGAGFITNILFNNEEILNQTGVDTNTKKGLSKMTIMVFWLLFVPILLALPVYAFVNKLI